MKSYRVRTITRCVRPALALQPEEACLFFRHTGFPICGWCAYRPPTDSPDPTADGISDRAFANTGKPCGYQSIIGSTLNTPRWIAGTGELIRAATGLLTTQTGKPRLRFQLFSARFIGSTLLMSLYFP